MEFSCEQEKLTKSLNIVSKAITSRTTIPILKGILIKCEDNDEKINLSSSDLEISIETKLEGNIETTGSTVVSAKLFSDIVRKLPSGIVNIELFDENQIKIKCGHSEFVLQGIDPEEFPVISKNHDGENLILNKKVLENIIKRTCFAASIEESRGIITGALMEIKSEDIKMIALDGFRMAVLREKIKNEKEINIVISARILKEIEKILSEREEDDDVDIIIDEKKVVFNVENTRIVARMLEGDFIKYNDIIPKDNKIKVKINKYDLAESVERSSLIATEGKNSFIKFNLSEETLTITSRSEEGTTKEEVAIEKEGDDLEIGFNARYMSDTLKAIPDEEIIMEFDTSISACLIKPVMGEEYEYLILPVRLSSVNV